MARMSIDDSVQRDPRITKLAKTLGWTRRETAGALICEVWPICYDQRNHEIVADLVDTATDRPGFASAMVDAGLARWLRGNRKVAINGARERIEYLDHKSAAGRIGGLKSGESRRQRSSTGGSTPQARGNPSSSASVPDPVPDPPPVPDPERESARARDPSSTEYALPEDWNPNREHAELAKRRGLDLEHEAALFVANTRKKGHRSPDWAAAFSFWLLKSKPESSTETPLGYALAVAGESP